MKLGFFSLLTLILITLKLTNYIDWSWWLVLLPAYGGLVLLLVIFVLLLITGQKPNFKINRTK